MKCKSCGMEIKDDSFLRCPRCNTIINLPQKCSECNGCSLFNDSKKDATTCTNKV
ncbi:hypothetical protein R9X47_03385 [Wukongibacter baidiensis]|uniref:hypothetical protein n=1 Tax=Wukongibacter baidiensis TaxID=1723361 RepID=UPI003D7FF325